MGTVYPISPSVKNESPAVVVGFHQAFASEYGGVFALRVHEDATLSLVYFSSTGGRSTSVPLTIPDVPDLIALLRRFLNESGAVGGVA